MSFFRDFYEHGKFVKSLNANFLVLIPEKTGAKDLRDFRPISLLGSLYKWLAKVLANRLKKVVGKVVSKAQGAFVEGRQILDAVLIAIEAIDGQCTMHTEGGMMWTKLRLMVFGFRRRMKSRKGWLEPFGLYCLIRGTSIFLFLGCNLRLWRLWML